MIKSLQLENFRSYSKLELQDLGRVNLIFGKNNSGKTAILEALLLASSPSQVRSVARSLNESRLGKRQTFRITIEDLFSGLFHDWNYENTIRVSWERVASTLELTGMGRTILLSANFFEVEKSSLFIDSSEPFSSDLRVQSIQVEISSGNVHSVYSIKEKDVLENSATRSNAKEMDLPVAYSTARGVQNGDIEAQRFSLLQVENKHHEVEKALKIIEPRLENLAVIAQERGSSLYGNMGVGRLIPLGQMGDGMLRILSIALSLSNSQNGIVLIDEVENGLHFSVQEDVWRLIFRTARRLNVQVFVTTHSDECLAAATRAAHFEDAFDDLRGIRIDRRENEVSVAVYEGKDLGFALTNGFEVRG